MSVPAAASARGRVHAHASVQSVLWAADAEQPFGQEWANESCASSSRVQRVSDPVAQGGFAYGLEVREGDDSYGERCELGMGNPTRNGFPLFNAGDERWISFQVYLPNDYPIDATSWNVFMQLKQLGSMGTPAVSMEVQRHRFILFNSNTNGESNDTIEKWSGPATQNRWVKFTLHVRFSPEDNVGFIELYGDLDGSGMSPLMPRTFMHTMKQQQGSPVPSHARIGLYRDASIHGGASHIYFDGYTIATDRASAEANAFAPPLSQSSVIAPPAATTPTEHGPSPHSSGSSAPSESTNSPGRSGAGSSHAGLGRLPGAHRAGIWLHARKLHAETGREGLRRIVGGLRTRLRSAHRLVVLEVRRAGSWSRVRSTRADAAGHFSFLIALPAATTELRVHIARAGDSRAISTRG